MADAVDSTYVPLAFGEATAWAKICLEDVVGTPTEGDDRELSARRSAWPWAYVLRVTVRSGRMTPDETPALVTVETPAIVRLGSEPAACAEAHGEVESLPSADQGAIGEAHRQR